MTHFNWRNILSFSVLSIILIFVLSSGAATAVYERIFDAFRGHSEALDFGQFTYLKTLHRKELSLDKAGHRAIFVGDIHGMSQSLEAILEESSYDSTRDKLIHCGDICAKGPLAGSLQVLSYMATNNVTGVRGNHDQKVVEWRAWMEWVEGLDKGSGRQWLETLNARWDEAEQEAKREDKKLKRKAWIEKQRKQAKGWERRLWKKVPEDWKMFGDHYQIARKMSDADYNYLVSLPLVLHIPSEHAFVAHAGILPYDPTRSITSQRQPLAHPPNIHDNTRSRVFGQSLWSSQQPESLSKLRKAQELSILHDIKKNNIPWVLQNMRSVLKDGEISKENFVGTPWSELWNSVMPRCAGYDDWDLSKEPGKSLPCQPSTVIYGHAATRGLDLKRWTKGLDSGCVYGRRMTALILDKPHEHHSRSTFDGEADNDDDFTAAASDDHVTDKTSFGDAGVAHIVSVSCHQHKHHKPSLDED